jgi:hypothetical protein
MVWGTPPPGYAKEVADQALARDSVYAMAL